MEYRISIRNRFGKFISRKFKNKQHAQKAIKALKYADKRINERGLIDTRGNVIKMKSTYKLVKDTIKKPLSKKIMDYYKKGYDVKQISKKVGSPKSNVLNTILKNR